MTTPSQTSSTNSGVSSLPIESVLAYLSECFASSSDGNVLTTDLATHFFPCSAVSQPASVDKPSCPSELYRLHTSSLSTSKHNDDKIIGLVKSLQSLNKVILTPVEKTSYYLTEEGVTYGVDGSPEARFVRYVFERFGQSQATHSEGESTEGSLSADVLRQALGSNIFDLGMKSAIRNQWIKMSKTDKSITPNSSCLVTNTLLSPGAAKTSCKENRVSSATSYPIPPELTKSPTEVPYVLDLVQIYIRAIGGGLGRSPVLGGDAEQVKERMNDERMMWAVVTKTIEETVELVVGQKFSTEEDFETILQDLRRRKLLECRRVTVYQVSKGEDFSAEVHKKLADLTQAMILNNAWLDADLKPYNFFACGKKQVRGSIHPLMRVAIKLKNVLFGMGFEEMQTNRWVEASFWNFDALFQPQQHPARDMQDTFFLNNPASTKGDRVPRDYLQRVKDIHEKGGFGSIGYRYEWSEEESMKNVLRTHTTATSARMLYALAQKTQQTGVFVPVKLFSIDRVFRNETLDATHLAEFHQVEGLVADRGLSMGHLIGILSAFYRRIGIEKLRFKPAFNPYTEPSMEVFGFHPLLKKWMEVGNSGFFRPEMLRPMGLPEDVVVMAWGLSVERPTMIQYGISNIRDLFGHKATLGAF
eukprot:GHVQ01024639.1.p1 GENE.GHVQ01024639.1~~GHVQ01024639.1.p1  ORF type:complete len:644 (+),score=67.24 GHVQ01024639.1:78-2009(+)